MDAETEVEQLTGPELACQIESVVTEAEPDHEQAQVCLWFDGVAERGPAVGAACGVASASVTTHQSGGGIARGGDHLDFQIDLSDWRRWTRRQKVRKCWRLIDAALNWAANNLGSVDECSYMDDDGEWFFY